MEAILTIGNGHHTRNLSGFFTKIFGGSNIFMELRVFRNSANSWDIAVYHVSYVHHTIVQVVHSGTRFIPNFENYINPPNPSGDTIYNITEYKGSMDVDSLFVNKKNPLDTSTISLAIGDGKTGFHHFDTGKFGMYANGTIIQDFYVGHEPVCANGLGSYPTIKKMTKAQYNALAVKHNSVIYFITE